MKLTDYLGVSAEVLQDYIDQGLVDTSFHPTFPLVIFTYSRKCVAEQAWDKVTTKCRGLIANTETDDVVARPFEKFFNYGDPMAGVQLANWTSNLDEATPGNAVIFHEPDTIYEKMDGFLCTMYKWDGKSHIASKGSFDSPHAKWATAVYNDRAPLIKQWPEGYTPVFEGITKNLRIVVDYGDREELVLIGLINVETGEELSAESLQIWAKANGFTTPLIESEKLETVTHVALDSTVKNFEGYVAVWHRPGMTPFRLKIKFQDYLRIHRLVTGVSPKRVLEALVNGWKSELDEWTNESTPWFNEFVSKWRKALESKYTALDEQAKTTIKMINDRLKFDGQLTMVNYAAARKAFALEFTKHPEIAPILFALLDGKDPAPFIWKRVKPMISGSHPMVDAAKL